MAGTETAVGGVTTNNNNKIKRWDGNQWISTDTVVVFR